MQTQTTKATQSVWVARSLKTSYRMLWLLLSFILSCMLTHNFPSLFGAVNWLQHFTSISHIHPIRRWHSSTVSLSSCCCLFKYDPFSAFSWFMLQFGVPPPPPHHCPVFAHSPPSSASSSHQPASLERVISHRYLDSTGEDALRSENLPGELKRQRLWRGSIITSSAVTNFFFTSFRCLSRLKSYF